jgi:hypothetical protein
MRAGRTPNPPMEPDAGLAVILADIPDGGGAEIMGDAITGRLRPRAMVVALAAGMAVLLTAPADAGLRLGPGAVLGLMAGPLRMMTHGIGGGRNRHAAHSQHTAPAPETRAPSGPPAEPQVVEARADTTRTAEPKPAASSAPAWPIASPSVYEDLLGYVLWPGDYADRLWGHGYGDIMNALLAPTTAANADQAASMIQSGMCSQKASELADQLVARTGEVIGPTPDQQVALDALRAGLGEAIKRGRTAVCAGTGDPLRRTMDGLWTMWDATLLMRTPLERFYDSLTPAQKAKLEGEAAAGQALARACADPRSADWSGERLERALAAQGPEQRRTLEALHRQSSELINFLAVSCPRDTKSTPLDRLQDAGERMNALLYVVMSMSPALADFYAPSGRTPPGGSAIKPAASDR